MTEGGGNEGLGFAISGSVVSLVSAQLKNYGEVRGGEIGASVRDITPALAQGLGLSRDWGVVVSDVVPSDLRVCSGQLSFLLTNGLPSVQRTHGRKERSVLVNCEQTAPTGSSTMIQEEKTRET